MSRCCRRGIVSPARRGLGPRTSRARAWCPLAIPALSRFRIDRLFTEHGVNRILRIETPLSEIACALVASGAGVTLCEPFTAHEYSTRGIVVRPFEPRLDFEFTVLYAEAERTSRPAREFIDSFRTHVVEFLRRQTWRTRS